MIAVLRNTAWIVGGIALAGLVHLAIVLLVPHVGETDTWTRLGRFHAVEGFQLLPPATPQSAPLRMADPATVVAICRYDLDEDGTVRVRGRANLPYWGLSLHTRSGAVYYAINNRSLADRPLDMRLMSADDLVRFRADLPEDAEQELLIPAPEAQGFVTVRALVPEPTARARVEAELGNLVCGPAT